MSESGVTVIYSERTAAALQISENGRVFELHKDKTGVHFNCYGSGGGDSISKELAVALSEALQRFVDTGEIKP